MANMLGRGASVEHGERESLRLKFYILSCSAERLDSSTPKSASTGVNPLVSMGGCPGAKGGRIVVSYPATFRSTSTL